MKKIVLFVLLILNYTAANAQLDTVVKSYFVTYNKEEYVKKLIALNIGINKADNFSLILKKINSFLENYVPNLKYTDDIYAKKSALQALKSVKQGGYGIGAVLIDGNGKILAEASNQQIQQQRSDLHAEMTLLTEFESKSATKKYKNSFIFKPGLTVVSSAEPCPMCFMRLAMAGVKTLYCSPGPDDGMGAHIDCLPQSWKGLAGQNPIKMAETAPVLQKLSHLLFFSFLMDQRGPK